jgi:phospholipid/cholesterol/gamma-HCH transport system permease protein
MVDRAGSVDCAIDNGELRIECAGAWTIDTASGLGRALDALAASGSSTHIDLSGVDRLDTTGAWIIFRLRERLTTAGDIVNIQGLDGEQRALFDRVADIGACEPVRPIPLHPIIAVLERTGRGVYEAFHDAVDLLNFLGVVTLAGLHSIARPKRIRLVPTFSHLERVGLDALPIVGLLAFLIGVVMAYQGADQLRRFGAEIFTVNLLGISIFREMGVLMTAIVIAGRSGSAFAAQIGTMQVNQEVDAMRTLGLDPIDMLVLPRLVAMVIAMPLLTIYADIMALMGGGLMVVLALDIPVLQFLDRLHGSVSLSSFSIGIIKAPVFGVLIALTGCREGLRVSGSAESVGTHTTRSVVISLFLVLVANALFSILFSLFRI